MLDIYTKKNRTYLWLFVSQLHVVYAQWTNVWLFTTVVWLLNCCVVIELTEKVALNP